MTMTMPVEGSNSLADLAARIRSAHRDVRNCLARSLERAFDAGDLLIEAKRQLKHGQWLPWVHDHCKMSERTAQRYIRLASRREAIEANPTFVSDLGIAGALALLTDPGAAAKVVTAVEAVEPIQDKAEAARREVILDAIECNNAAIKALKERWVPDDFRSDCPELESFWKEPTERIADAGDEYALAVECGDHAGAFALVSWVHNLSVDMRSMGDDIARAAEG
jgi:hypothetical protein